MPNKCGTTWVHLFFAAVQLSGSLVVLEMSTEPGHAYQAVVAICFIILCCSIEEK